MWEGSEEAGVNSWRSKADGEGAIWVSNLRRPPRKRRCAYAETAGGVKERGAGERGEPM